MSRIVTKFSVIGSALLAVALLSWSFASPTYGDEKHPHIHAALKELRECRKELKEAAHDFNGHREEALKAVDAAVEQLEICKNHDR